MKKNTQDILNLQSSRYHVGKPPAVSHHYAKVSRAADIAAQKAINAKPKKSKSGGW